MVYKINSTLSFLKQNFPIKSWIYKGSGKQGNVYACIGVFINRQFGIHTQQNMMQCSTNYNGKRSGERRAQGKTINDNNSLFQKATYYKSQIAVRYNNVHFNLTAVWKVKSEVKYLFVGYTLCAFTDTYIVQTLQMSHRQIDINIIHFS